LAGLGRKLVRNLPTVVSEKKFKLFLGTPACEGKPFLSLRSFQGTAALKQQNLKKTGDKHYSKYIDKFA